MIRKICAYYWDLKEKTIQKLESFENYSSPFRKLHEKHIEKRLKKWHKRGNMAAKYIKNYIDNVN